MKKGGIPFCPRLAATLPVMARTGETPSDVPVVGDLEQEDVVTRRRQKAAQVGSEPEDAGIRVVGAVLRPNEVDQRAGEIFPAEDDSSPQRFQVEIGVLEREGGRRSAAVGVDGESPVRVGNGRCANWNAAAASCPGL